MERQPVRKLFCCQVEVPRKPGITLAIVEKIPLYILHIRIVNGTLLHKKEVGLTDYASEYNHQFKNLEIFLVCKQHLIKLPQ